MEFEEGEETKEGEELEAAAGSQSNREAFCIQFEEEKERKAAAGSQSGREACCIHFEGGEVAGGSRWGTT